MNKPEVICEPLSPFGYAAMVILSHKGIEFDATIVSKQRLKEEQQWLSGISPLRRLPVLKAEGHFIFGTCAICEYIDEAYPHSIQPKKAIAKAQNRSWMEYAVSLKKHLNDFTCAITAEDSNGFRDSVEHCLFRLEKNLIHRPYFNGERFSVVDAIYSPLLAYIHVIKEAFGCELLSDFSRLRNWLEVLLANEDVKKIIDDRFFAEYEKSIRDKSSFLIHGQSTVYKSSH